jgi:hypothetical protein
MSAPTTHMTETTEMTITTRRTAMKTRRQLNRQLTTATAIALALLAAACGGDDDTSDATVPPAATAVATAAPATTPVTTAAPVTTTPATTAAPATTAMDVSEPVGIVTSDYAFGGVPASVAPGTAFEIHNTSATELHEFVVVRLPDTETRPVDELVHHDLMSVLTAGPPAMVLLAPPGSGEQIVAVGDGTVTEPGRYLAICMIPTGADPMAYMEAAAKSNGGPPSVPGGAPHAMAGMYAEFTVA